MAPGPRLRPAGPNDARAVAELHAGSWTDRLRERDPGRCTILAEDGGLVGFANTFFDHDPRWGALLDNLHVAEGHRRRGIGARLLALTAKAVAERPGGTGLYLWGLEQNADARAFYEAHGARCAGRAPVSPPGGIAGRVSGSPTKLRYAWPEPAAHVSLSGGE